MQSIINEVVSKLNLTILDENNYYMSINPAILLEYLEDREDQLTDYNKRDLNKLKDARPELFSISKEELKQLILDTHAKLIAEQEAEKIAQELEKSIKKQRLEQKLALLGLDQEDLKTLLGV